MALGYEVYEDDRDFEKEGITGEVSKYSLTNLQYPCLMAISVKDNELPRYRVEVLHHMIQSIHTDNFDADLLDSRIHIYIAIEDKIYKLGQLFPKQVKSFLSLFDGFLVRGYLDKDTELEGMYLYTLAE